MSKPARGLRIGQYRITPLGLVTLAVLLLLIAAAIVLFVVRPFDLTGTIFGPRATPTPSPTIEPEPTPVPTPEPTPVPDPRSATIRSLGEIAMQQNLLRAAVSENTFDFAPMFSEISDVIGNADYTVADVEGTLGDTTDYSGNGSKLITPSSLIGVLKDCGVDMLMLANDHALDGGFNEQQATVKNCISMGMDYVGAATSIEEKNSPNIKEINGINVAFLAYTETLNGKEKKTNTAATRYGVNLITASNALKDISNAKKAGADVIVCYVSWGKMLQRNIGADQAKIAQYLAKAGVDVIIGYNPHVVQRAAWIETTSSGKVHRTLCLGATGNFLSDQRDRYSDSGIIFEFTIQETGPASGEFKITAPKYIPTYVWRSSSGKRYSYRTMPVGKWLEEQPEGMSYIDVTRMRQVWAEVQNIMGKGVVSISAE